MLFKKFGKSFMACLVVGFIFCFMPSTIPTGQSAPASDKRVGIVYSQATATRYWDITAYSQLFMVAQHQTMMAGIPFDLLTEDDLMDINKLSNYEAIIFPYFSNVTQSKLAAIQNALTQAVNTYHVGLITGGEFMTVNESGAGLADYQARMNNLLGVQISSFSSNVTATIRADVITHPVMKGYAANEQILQYTGFYFPQVIPFSTSTVNTRLAKWVLSTNTEGNAVLATQTGGRNVFFANEQIMADANLLWQAIQWVVYGNEVPVGLKMTRFNNVLTSRVDMDQTGYSADVTTVGQPLLTLLTQWKNNYNLISSLHINVGPSGSNSSNTTGIDSWLSLHQQYTALGNEIGTHSWSHPQDIGPLTATQREFEFNQSKNMIGQKLGITVVGSAIPGNTETLAVDKELSAYFNSANGYISGRYGYLNSGYGTSIGFIDPSYTMVYYHMNFRPDYTILSFENKTAAQAEQEWKSAYAYINLHGSQPICHWMWHDYGPTSGPNGDGSNYTTALFTNMITHFYNNGSEFATQADVTERINIFRNPLTSLQVTPGATSDDVNVQIAQTNVGKFELLVNSDKVIKNVDNWYAYNQKGVFLKKDGGSYNIHLGATQDKLTHISSLPMRSELISVTGTGSEIEFTFIGQGKVTVELNAPAGAQLTIEGADSSNRVGDTLTLTFNQPGSHTARVLVPPTNTPPQVSLTSPANNALFTTPVNITLQADASDPGGSVTKMEFFNGAVKLGEDLISPYSFDWNAVAAGNYSLTAKATDNLGAVTTSTAVSIVVNTPPSVTLTSPLNNATFTAPANINLTADAADSNGTVSKVEFYNGATKLGEDTSSPYSFDWNAVVVGNYPLTAKATDNHGAVTTSAVNNIIVNSTAPTVNITNPLNNAVFNNPANILIEATASDADGTITKVEFFSGTTLLGEDTTAPYSFAWNNVVTGNYAFTAKATDNAGLFTTSSVINVIVNAFPTVSLTAPVNNTLFTAPATVSIEATAADIDGTISKVEFFNGAVKLGEDLTAPYSFVWNNVPSGNYILTAKATDNRTAITTSDAVNIAVNGPPVVALTNPINNAVFLTPADITLEATASDIGGSVNKVEFFAGNVLLGEDLTSPYGFVWSGAAVGNHVLTAKATDNQNLSTTSAAVNIAVNQAPTVSLISPVNNAVFNAPAAIALEATASDTNGGTISKVEFYNGAVKLGEDTTSPYIFDWTNVGAGNYTLSAWATDNQGALTTSTAVNIVVNGPPSVALTNPINNAVILFPANITLDATASDGNGTVSKVEFFADNVLLGEDLTSPYSFVWSGAAAGNHILTAKATDNQNLSTTSTAVNIVVNAVPTVMITSPVDNATFTAPALVNITADAADANGTISKVEFFNGAAKIGEDTTAPYSFDWTNVGSGNYFLTAKVTDNHNTVGESMKVNIIVNGPPSVNITSPLNNAVFNNPANISITADAQDGDGSVTQVEFFNGNTSLVVDTTAPYSFDWNNVPAGNYVLTAKAADDHGSVTTSNAVNITVNPGTTPPIEATYVSIAGEDGWIRESTETSNVGGAIGAIGTANLAIRMGDNFNNRQFKSILSFDTSSIPEGATILSATLQLTRGGTAGDDAFNTHGTCYVDIKNGGFNNNTALENVDFQAIADSSQAAIITNQGGSLTLYTVNISDAALSQVNKIGKTQLRLYFSLDDNDNWEDDYSGFYSGDNSNAGRRPKLVVKYQP